MATDTAPHRTASRSTPRVRWLAAALTERRARVAARSRTTRYAVRVDGTGRLTAVHGRLPLDVDNFEVAIAKGNFQVRD